MFSFATDAIFRNVSHVWDALLRIKLETVDFQHRIIDH